MPAAGARQPAPRRGGVVDRQVSFPDLPGEFLSGLSVTLTSCASIGFFQVRFEGPAGAARPGQCHSGV